MQLTSVQLLTRTRYNYVLQTATEVTFVEFWYAQKNGKWVLHEYSIPIWFQYPTHAYKKIEPRKTNEVT
jgi:hypothetical protein